MKMARYKEELLHRQQMRGSSMEFKYAEKMRQMIDMIMTRQLTSQSPHSSSMLSLINACTSFPSQINAFGFPTILFNSIFASSNLFRLPGVLGVCRLFVSRICEIFILACFLSFLRATMTGTEDLVTK